MISDSNPTPLDDSKKDERAKFEWPPLMAITSTKNINKIRPYCYNIFMTEQDKYDGNADYPLEFKHTFMENCQLLTRLQPWLGILAVYGIITGVIWVCCLYKIQRGRQYVLQPWLSIIPFTKAIWEMQLMLEYSTCPWTSDDSIVIISLFSSEVLSVITVICFNTILCCIFYLLSLGWNITMFRIKRSQLTNLVLLGGSLYLVQLAQNYS